MRPLDPRDEGALGSLLIDAFTHAYGLKKPEFHIPESRKEELRAAARVREGVVVVVTEDSQGLAGSSTLILPHARRLEAKSWEPELGEIRFVVTRPDLQGSGLGKDLVLATLKKARECGLPGVVIHVRRGLPRLEAWYQAIGFIRDPRGDYSYTAGIDLNGFKILLS